MTGRARAGLKYRPARYLGHPRPGTALFRIASISPAPGRCPRPRRVPSLPLVPPGWPGSRSRHPARSHDEPHHVWPSRGEALKLAPGSATWAIQAIPRSDGTSAGARPPGAPISWSRREPGSDGCSGHPGSLADSAPL